MKAIRSYLTFASTGYRILGLILFPIAMYIGTLVLLLTDGTHQWDGMFDFLPVWFIVTYVMVLEMMADYWFLGGICSKECELEYLKNSARGMKVVNGAIQVDLLRRLCYFLIYALTCMAVTRDLRMMVLLLTAYIFTTIGLNITRYMNVFQMYVLAMMCVVILCQIVSFLLCMLFRSEVMLASCVVILAILVIAVNILSGIHLNKRIRGSYYERKF